MLTHPQYACAVLNHSKAYAFSWQAPCHQKALRFLVLSAPEPRERKELIAVAIYHANISIVSRSSGASAVAGAAYLSRSILTDERTGERHNYSRAHQHERLVHDFGVTLPPKSPKQFENRSNLWNEVERLEKQSNAQLARRFVVALPDELLEPEQIKLARSIINYFVSQGMVCDSALHENVNGSNCHLHILTPLRSVNEKGFEPKSKTAYHVRLGGQDAWMDAQEFKQREYEGWEKVYTYSNQKKKKKLTLSEAAAEEGWERLNKYPEKRKERTVDWDDRNNAEIWRAEIAKLINESLEKSRIDVRVDHRSYERQGIERIPTKHLGSYAHRRELEAQEEALENNQKYEPVTELGQYNYLTEVTNYVNNKATAEYRSVIRERIGELRSRIAECKEKFGVVQAESNRVETSREQTYGRVQQLRNRIAKLIEKINDFVLAFWDVEPPAWAALEYFRESSKTYARRQTQKEKEEESVILTSQNELDAELIPDTSPEPEPYTLPITPPAPYYPPSGIDFTI